MADTPFINISATASLYSQIAGVLSGFAFTTLLSYLNRHTEEPIEPTPEQGAAHQLLSEVRRQVTIVLFNTLGALVVCAVLYGMLAGGPPDTGNSLSGIMVNGPAFGLAILGMFFATALAATPFKHLEPMLASARVLLAIVGPAIAMLLVAAASMDLFIKQCRDVAPAGPCAATSQLTLTRPYGLGVWLTVLLALIGVVALIAFRTPQSPAPAWTARAMAWLIIGVPAITVVGAIAVATMPADYLLPDPLKIVIELATFAILALFAVLAARTCHHHPSNTEHRINRPEADTRIAA
ncbi:hypothetical protein ACN26Y_28705 [Micromonospora sp. WMMD558]|uniref:hypothetical protein n=1 Tax=Micromonospora sp. WMMD558 TaxID=3403462 RepID=UPI003BF5854F